jgi:phosphohistidine phosphatase
MGELGRVQTRTLIVMRHGRAEDVSPAGVDRARRLTAAGRRDATAVGRQLAARGFSPELVLCSSAVRTRETWEQIAPGLGASARVLSLDGLYGAEVHDLLGQLCRVEDDVACVLLVGHNPAVSELVERLTARDGGSLAPADAVVCVGNLDAWASTGCAAWRVLERVRAG